MALPPGTSARSDVQTKGSGSGSMPLDGDDKNLVGLRQLSGMFDYSRIDTSASCCSLLLLVLYAPIGVVLVPLRLVLTVVMGLISMLQCTSFCVPRKWHTVLLRIQLFIFIGVWINIKGEPAPGTPLWVANHLSEVDAIVLRAISDPYILGYHFYQKIWWLKLSPLRIFKMIYVPHQSRTEGNAAGRDELNNVIKKTLEKPGEVLLLFPEGGLTNGRVGLLQYHKFVFGLGLQVQPIALTLNSPLPLHADTMYASFLSNILCFLFVPFHTYTVEFMAPVAIDVESEETALDFSRRVMSLTAKKLNIEASPFLYSDKKKWGRLRNSLSDDGLKLDIVVNKDKRSVVVVNKSSKMKQHHKQSAVVPVEKIPPKKDANGPTSAPASPRSELLDRLYESWQMTQTNFSHLCFTPAENASEIEQVSLCVASRQNSVQQ
jgi:ancient ubiquitous protein 1